MDRLRDIYGFEFTGERIREHKNTVTFRSGLDTFVVRKEDLGMPLLDPSPRFKFDLQTCQLSGINANYVFKRRFYATR